MYSDMYVSESLVETTMYSAPLMGLFFGIMIFTIILSLISIISNWKIFTKAGKPGWASIVPIYNIIVMIQIAKLPIWYIVLFLIPIANIYALFKINIEIAKKFGKSAGFGIGMTLVSIIFVPLLAFSDNKYEDDKITQSNENTNNTFDATNVINSSQNSMPLENQNLNIQESIPVEPTIEVETSNNIENVSNEVPLMNEISSNIAVELQTEIPANENIVEPTIQYEPVMNSNIEINNEEINNVPSVEEPIVNKSIEVPNAFNSVPPNNEEINNVPSVEEPIVNESSEVLNAFNSVPISTENPAIENVDNSNEFLVNSEPVQEVVIETLQNNNVETPEVAPQVITELPNMNESTSINEIKKVCKSCGTELPNIVSICPKCGTDNE